MAVLTAAVGIARRRFAAEIQAHVDRLYVNVDDQTDGRFDTDEIAELPAPVRRYFDRVLEPDQQFVRSVQLRQRGEFRFGGADDGWIPFRATQDVTTQPPGFVWDAIMVVAPFTSVRVLDCYSDGKGLLRARLLGAVPVANVGPTPEMDEGELVRYLAEGVWFPTALLPTQGVQWEAIDDGSARATLNDDGVTASVVFHFSDDDEIERVTALRYRQEQDDFARWIGYFRKYEQRNGTRVPSEAEVAWDQPEGELSYWRATIEDVEYRYNS